jgi:tetratricopeptide (TPR) repeat protein
VYIAKSIVTAIVFCAAPALCQSPRTYLAGKVEGAAGDLNVELREQGNRLLVLRENVARDGTFIFRDVPSGAYEVRVVTTLYGETLLQEFIEVNSLTASSLLLRLPKVAKSRPVSGTVSVKQLQSPVPKKAFQAFVKAQHYVESAQPGPAIEQLQLAIKLDPQWRDAHVNLGAQFARAGRSREAVAEFEEALRIGPPAALIYTNYGAALASVNRMPEAEAAVREALRLEPKSARPNYLLGHILATRPGQEEEALSHLRAAFDEVPNARIVAAQVLWRRGDQAGAVTQLREYLKTGDSSHRAEVETSLAQLQGK